MSRERALAEACAHAVVEFPRESCGLIVQGLDGSEWYHPCRNAAVTPSEHFVLPPEDWDAAEQTGDVIAVVHSHPGHPARPSEGDLASCEATEIEWIIIRTDRDEVSGQITATETHSWRPSGWRAPLLGRSFHYGVLDCWALARDWYQEEMGIDLSKVPLDRGVDGWWNDPASTFSPYEDPENMAKLGFVRIDGPPSRRGDLIVMQVRSRAGKPNHVGVLVDDQRGIMLHHLYNALSERTVYGGYWQETTRFVLRRKE